MTRIIAACVLFIIVGGTLFAAYRIPKENLGLTQLSRVQSTCTECHYVPVFVSAEQVHDSHVFLSCIYCHPGGSGARVNFNICQDCHGVPLYTSAVAMHDSHTEFDCTVCHVDARLEPAVKTQNIWRTAGIGIIGLGGLGLLLNFVVLKFRKKPGVKNGK